MAKYPHAGQDSIRFLDKNSHPTQHTNPTEATYNVGLVIDTWNNEALEMPRASGNSRTKEITKEFGLLFEDMLELGGRAFHTRPDMLVYPVKMDQPNLDQKLANIQKVTQEVIENKGVSKSKKTNPADNSYFQNARLIKNFEKEIELDKNGIPFNPNRAAGILGEEIVKSDQQLEQLKEELERKIAEKEQHMKGLQKLAEKWDVKQRVDIQIKLKRQNQQENQYSIRH